MGWGTAVAIYFVIWWTLLFAVLPLGVRSQAEANDVVPGTEPAAPVAPQLWKKAGITSVVAALAFALFYYVRFHSGLSLADLPGFPEIKY